MWMYQNGSLRRICFASGLRSTWRVARSLRIKTTSSSYVPLPTPPLRLALAASSARLCWNSAAMRCFSSSAASALRFSCEIGIGAASAPPPTVCSGMCRPPPLALGRALWKEARFSPKLRAGSTDGWPIPGGGLLISALGSGAPASGASRPCSMPPMPVGRGLRPLVRLSSACGFCAP